MVNLTSLELHAVAYLSSCQEPSSRLGMVAHAYNQHPRKPWLGLGIVV